MTEIDALLPAVREGDGRAQEKLYQKLAARMLAVCRRYLHDPIEAEDAMISAFVKVFRCAKQYEGRGAFEAWIRRIMVYECLARLRQREPLHFSVDDYAGQVAIATPASIESDIAVADLMHLLDHLPAGYRTVFLLHAVEGYGHNEIAETLGISEGTSKSQLSKARTMLQRMLIQRGSTVQPVAPLDPLPAGKMMLAF